MNWLGALLLVLLVGFAALLYTAEWKEELRNDGFGPEAHRNPYLAAQQFLARLAVDVRQRDGLALLDDLPSTEHLLLLAGSRRSLSERRTNALERWIEGGGRLVLLATESWDEETQSSGDRLLDRLGIRLVSAMDRPDWTMGLEALTETLGEGECRQAGALTRVDPGDGSQALQVGLARHRLLRYDGALAADASLNPLGAQLYRLRLGAGDLVVLTDLGLWRNVRIGCWDNAHLLRLLTADRPTLWWLHNVEVPPLPVAIWQRFPALVLVCLAWLALWVWHSGFRPLPPRAEAPAPRRQLVEQLDGSARFRWQQGLREQLLAPLRRRLAAPDGEAEAVRLAAASGIPEGQVRWALTAVPANGQQFLRMVRTLQRLLDAQ